MTFMPLALAGPAQAAINDVAILALQPPLSPQPSLAPPGEKGSSTAVCGRVLEVVEFTVNRQHSNGPSTAACGHVFKDVAFTLVGYPSKRTQAASVESPAHVVPGRFECWRLHVNGTPDKALAE